MCAFRLPHALRVTRIVGRMAEDCHRLLSEAAPCRGSGSSAPVLREAGFVESRVEAQRRVYRIRPEPLMEVDAWLAPFRRFWTAHVDALECHLDRMELTSRKGKKR